MDGLEKNKVVGADRQSPPIRRFCIHLSLRLLACKVVVGSPTSQLKFKQPLNKVQIAQMPILFLLYFSLARMQGRTSARHRYKFSQRCTAKAQIKHIISANKRVWRGSQRVPYSSARVG
jgi:hypothetical protein